MPVLHRVVPLLVTRLPGSHALERFGLPLRSRPRRTEGVEGSPDRADAVSVLIRCLETL